MANAKISDNSVFLTTVTDVLNIDGFAAYSTASATGNAAMSGTQLVASLEANINLSNMASGTWPADRGGTGITNFSLADFANDDVDYSNDGSGVLPFAKGGTGVNNFAGSGFVTTSGSSFSFTSSIDLSGSDVANVLPIDKGGTGYNNSYKSVQVFVWTNGGPVGYNNVPNSTPTKIPFDPTAIISTIQPSTLANAQWVCTNSGAGFPGTFATFTLGTAGAGLWKVRVAQHWLDQTNQVEIRGSFVLGGSTAVTIDVIDEKSTEFTGDKIFYGELIQEFAAGDTLELELEFIGGGVNPYPSANGNRPPEISFERLI